MSERSKKPDLQFFIQQEKYLVDHSSLQPPTQSNFQIKIHNFNVIQDTKQGKECKIVSTSLVENNDAFLKQKKPLSKLSFSGKHCFNSFLFDSKKF